MAVIAIALTISLLVWRLHASPTCANAGRCTAATFNGVVSLPGVTVSVEKVDNIPQNGKYGDPNDKGFPQTIDRLPELCAVTIKVTNTSDLPEKPQSDYRFGMFLPPSQKWNSRFLAIGSGSFAGGINWPGMSEGSHYGFATISTDNGHNSNGSDMTWVTPARLYDWGYRAMHGSVQVGKLLVNHYYNDSFTYAYYTGCSTGGRQGLREIQYDADSFDGALIGSAAWDTVRLMPWVSKIAFDELNGDSRDILGIQQFGILAAEVLSQCDSQDGHTDNIISQPDSCVFDIGRIVCSDPTRCLTEGQARAAMRIWSDYNVSGHLVTHGFDFSSEDQWVVYFGDTDTLTGFDFSAERYMIYNNTDWPWQNFSDQVVTDMERVNPGQATADHFDISPYRDRPNKKGGKILMYHGLADGLISPRTSLQYYNETIAAMNTDLDSIRSWFRFFEVPGMQHCWFSNRYNAPWDFGAAGQAMQLRLLPNLGVGLPAVGDGWSVPGHLGDPNYDALAALVQWVENDKPVDQIIATAFSADFSVNRTRPLCPYPERATYRSGNINDASSWHCA
jgi:feruloyl esterase